MCFVFIFLFAIGQTNSNKLIAAIRFFVQFIDGDCQLIADWLPSGLNALRDQEQLGVACGRCREVHPERSVYNRLCDMEWNTPVGEVKSCGGIALST